MKTETLQKLLKLSPDDRILARHEIDQGSKTMWIAYLLWFVLGMWGGHHYYLAFRKGSNFGIGHFIIGLIYTFTAGLFGMGWLMDVIGTKFYVGSINEKLEDEVILRYGG